MCHLDAGHKEDAEKACSSAVLLVKSHVPDKVEAIIRLQVSKIGSCKNTWFN